MFLTSILQSLAMSSNVILCGRGIRRRIKSCFPILFTFILGRRSKTFKSDFEDCIKRMHRKSKMENCLPLLGRANVQCY